MAASAHRLRLASPSISMKAFDVFFEFVPGMGLLPETRFDIGGAIGARYFF